MMTKLEFNRRRKGLKLREVAQAAGCSDAFVSLVERGKRTPSPLLAQKLAEAVGMNLRDFKSLQKPA